MKSNVKTLSNTLKIAQDKYSELFDVVHEAQNKQSEIVKSFSKIYEDYIIEKKLLDNLTFCHILKRDDLDFDISTKETNHSFSFKCDLSKNKAWKELINFWIEDEDNTNTVGRKPSDLNVDGCHIDFSFYSFTKLNIKSINFNNCLTFSFKGSQEAIDFFKRHNITFVSNDIDKRIEIYKTHIHNMEVLKQKFTK